MAGVLCASLSIVGLVIFFGLKAIEFRNQLQRNSFLQELVMVNDMVQNAGLAQAEILRCVTSRDPETFGKHQLIFQELEKKQVSLAKSYGQIADPGEETALFKQTESTWAVYLEKNRQVMNLGMAPQSSAGSALYSQQTDAFWKYSTALQQLSDNCEKEGVNFAEATGKVIFQVKALGNVFLAIALLVFVGIGFGVVNVIRSLDRDKGLLKEEIANRKLTEEDLREQTAFLNAQMDSTIDGILVVDREGKKILQNQRMMELWNIPSGTEQELSDDPGLEWMTDAANDSVQFSEKVVYLNAHPDEVSRDEFELREGVLVDRFSAPVIGRDGKVYGRIWTFRDITERHQAQTALRQVQIKYQTLFENMMEGYAYCRAVYEQGEMKDYTYLRVNDSFERITGLKNVTSKRVSDVVPGGCHVHADFFAVYQRVLGTGIPEKAELFSKALQKWFAISVYSQEPDTFVVVFDDVTKRKLEEETLRLLNSAVLQSREAIVITDAGIDFPGPKIIFVNAGYSRMSGYSEEEVIGKTPRIMQGQRTDRKILNQLRQAMEEGQNFHGETINYRKNGDEFFMEWQVAPIRNETGTITHFVSVQRDISERKLWESTLRESEERFGALFDLGPFAIYSCDCEGIIKAYNRRAVELWGRVPQAEDEKQLFYGPVRLYLPDGTPIPLGSSDMALLLEGKSKVASDVEIVVERMDGSRVSVLMNIVPLTNSLGNISGAINCFHDITERKRLEAQLLQSQKLETVGKLAGGVAHEFNSILTAIIGQAELISNELSPEDALRSNVAEISHAAARAAILTRQLLAYGRKQFLRLEILDLNQILSDMEGMFRHLMGEDVLTKVVPGLNLKTVQGDAGQIEQVLINMTINAREAMKNGGTLILETSNTLMDAESLKNNPELVLGEYVVLAISDTGRGMTPEVRARIFEPFFSTKPDGEGAGLGLSTCYGIIKQSRGNITVYSEPGRGSTFRIYLPVAQNVSGGEEPILTDKALPRGKESILLVEDDHALRNMATTLLRGLGYIVWPAADGAEALALSDREIGFIHLIFIDVNYQSDELASAVGEKYPKARMLSTSTYANALRSRGLVLEKPFNPSTLVQKIRQALD